MKKNSIPSRSFLTSARKIVESEMRARFSPLIDFNTARKTCFNSRILQQLILSRGITRFYEISAGTSDVNTYQGFIRQISRDFKKNRYYKNYTIPRGNLEALDAVAFLESLKLGSNLSFNYKDICFTEGATGAITMIFEYIKRYFPEGEVLIPTPTYYIYSYAAKLYNLPYKEVIAIQNNNSTTSFISIEKILSKVTKKTKLIVIVNPINPSGEIYKEEDLEKLLLTAKQKNLLILVDALFEELVFDKNLYIPIEKIAAKLKALENLVAVKGYSKAKNLPGLRIGYLFSKNLELVDTCSQISELRQCFPTASNFSGLIALDSFLQSVDYILIQNNENIDLGGLIVKMKEEFRFSETIKGKSKQELVEDYISYQSYMRNLLQWYLKLYDDSIDILGEDLISSSPKQSAFNTLVKIRDLDGVNLFDFTLNLYLTSGVKTELGPCYGLTQNDWECDSLLGFWLRLTFARERDQYIEGIKKFLEFKNLYLNYPNIFLKTNLIF